MKSKPFALTAAGILAGYAAGYFTARTGDARDSVTSAKTIPIQSGIRQAQVPLTGSPAGTGLPALMNGTLALSPSGNEQRRGEVAALAVGVLDMRNPAERLEAWLKFLKHLEPGDIDGVIDAFGKHDQEGRLFTDEWRVMMSSFGAVDGKGLMEWMVSDGGGRAVDANMGRGMTAWALAAPAEAVEWWNALPESPFRDSIAGPLIAGIAEKDPEKAWACVGLFPEEERPRFAGAFIKATLAGGGVESAVRWLESLEGKGAEAPPGFGAAAVGAFLQDACNIEPARRAELLRNVASTDWGAESEAFVPLAAQYASADTPGAAAWGASLSAKGAAATLPLILDIWSQKAPAEASRWLEEHSGQPWAAGVAEHLQETVQRRQERVQAR